MGFEYMDCDSDLHPAWAIAIVIVITAAFLSIPTYPAMQIVEEAEIIVDANSQGLLIGDVSDDSGQYYQFLLREEGGNTINPHRAFAENVKISVTETMPSEHTYYVRVTFERARYKNIGLEPELRIKNFYDLTPSLEVYGVRKLEIFIPQGTLIADAH